MKPTRAEIVSWIRELTPFACKTTPRELIRSMYTAVKLRDAESCRFLGRVAIAMGADVEEAIRVNETKGRDYTQGSRDTLANFYRVAELCNVSPMIVWSVYVTKHIEAIKSYIQGLGESEPIAGRLVDVLVYSALGYFIVEREQNTRVNLDER